MDGPDHDACRLTFQLVQRNYDDYAATSQALIDSLSEQLTLARAELDAIRAGVEYAYSGPWQPREDTVRRALHPDEDSIAYHRLKGES